MSDDKLNKQTEISVEELKINIKNFLNKDINDIDVCNVDIYKLCAALEECLREQIDINKKLLSNQKGVIYTSDILIKRIISALAKLEDYSIDVESLKNGIENKNDTIVNTVYCILKDGIYGEDNC